MNRTLLCAITFACIGAVPAAAQTLPSMSSILQSVFSMRSYSGVAISSRGNAFAWEEATTAGGLTHPVRETALFIRNGSNPPVRLTAGDPKSYYDGRRTVAALHSSRTRFVRSSRFSSLPPTEAAFAGSRTLPAPHNRYVGRPTGGISRCSTSRILIARRVRLQPERGKSASSVPWSTNNA